MEVQTQLQMNLSDILPGGRAYLNELECSDPFSFSYTAYNDERASEWEHEREIYGFDSTETWDLAETFYAWLYEHLRMYQDKAGKIVNLHYHKFEWRGKEYYQDEIIDMILERLRFRFSDEYDGFEAEQNLYIDEIGELWAIVLPAMWW